MKFFSFIKDGPEISDAIVSYDPATLERHPVAKSVVLQEFAKVNNRTAVRIVQRLPERDGELDPEAVDNLLVRVHCEMQRISEEFQHGRRVAELLNPILDALRDKRGGKPVRIVDIGCGTGYVLRWLAANRALGPDVELIGADLNAALIREAQRLTDAEKLECKFVTANAFALDHPADIYLSTGILHHFREGSLHELLRQHDRPDTSAFVHFDFHPSPMAPLGSWLFHAVRMREPLAKHDGVLSAIRAHESRCLLEAARGAAPGFISTIFGTRLWGLPIPRVFHSLVGVRPEYHEPFLKQMGSRIDSLGKIE